METLLGNGVYNILRDSNKSFSINTHYRQHNDIFSSININQKSDHNPIKSRQVIWLFALELGIAN